MNGEDTFEWTAAWNEMEVGILGEELMKDTGLCGLYLVLLSAVFIRVDVDFGRRLGLMVNWILATAVRTVVVRCRLMVFVTNNQNGLFEISRASWPSLDFIRDCGRGCGFVTARRFRWGVQQAAAVDKLSIVFTLIVLAFSSYTPRLHCEVLDWLHW